MTVKPEFGAGYFLLLCASFHRSMWVLQTNKAIIAEGPKQTLVMRSWQDSTAVGQPLNQEQQLRIAIGSRAETG